MTKKQARQLDQDILDYIEEKAKEYPQYLSDAYLSGDLVNVGTPESLGQDADIFVSGFLLPMMEQDHPEWVNVVSPGWPSAEDVGPYIDHSRKVFKDFYGDQKDVYAVAVSSTDQMIGPFDQTQAIRFLTHIKRKGYQAEIRNLSWILGERASTQSLVNPSDLGPLEKESNYKEKIKKFADILDKRGFTLEAKDLQKLIR